MERIGWRVDETVTSDHYGTITTLMDSGPAEIPRPNPRWKTDKANWQAFQSALARCLRSNEPTQSENVEVLQARLVNAIDEAASLTIPKTRPGSRSHKDAWYFNDEIREVNHRVNMCRKHFRRQRTPDNLALLREAVRDAKETASRVRQEKWLEWCESFDHRTTLSELWQRVKRATSRSAPRCTHHDPQAEANRLAQEFSARTSSDSLPAELRARQERLQPDRLAHIRERAAEPDNSDVIFSLRELRDAHKASCNSAPGDDGISYPIISRLGLVGELAFLQLINKSWETSTLPQSWKRATIVPIPKPKEPGKYRPISLLSCLAKTAERMVLNRLQWKMGAPHEHLHGFTRGMSTAHSIATLLSTINTGASVAVFLDLEKAFELASPLAIQESLIQKGIRGKLLAWIGDYFTNRTARVKFQGHLSQHMPLENGTPQGGVLSPALFNTLMSCILNINLPVGCKIISYADDIAIISTGPYCLNKAQRCLDLVSEECCRTGLKISAAKSKAMALRQRVQGTSLKIQGMDLEWVQEYLYLGVRIDRTLSFRQEVQYLLDRTKARLSVMRVMSGRRIGARHRVLRSFYVHAVRPIVDYASLALIGIKRKYKDRLETVQNEAARVILGAPRWAKVLNLLVETNLLPLASRIDLTAAQFLSKVIQAPRNTSLRHKIVRRLEQDNELFANNSWLSHTARVLIRHQLKEPLLAKGMDSPHPDFVEAPPWAQTSIEFSVMRLASKKNEYCTPSLKAETQRVIATITPPGSLTYYTDGSVDPLTHTAGAGFAARDATISMRVTDNASSLQAEVVAIMGALRHASRRKGHVVIHTDSKGAVDCLQQRSPTDNIYLLTTIGTITQRMLAQGRRIIINWVPSHIGIRGNELADRLAEIGRGMPPNPMIIHQSRSLLRRKCTVAANSFLLQLHREETRHSPSASWYSDATGYEPLALSEINNRGTEVILHRMRLGYHCAWQIIQTIEHEERCCMHCGEPNATLIHYLENCVHTQFLRQTPQNTAVVLVKRLCEMLTPRLQERLLAIPPPR